MSLSAGAEIRIENAWVREPPPVATPLAGYLRIVNVDERARVLVAVRGSIAGSIEVHRTERRNGVVRMRRLSQLEVPAAGEVQLEPGGAHLMIFGVTEPVRAGGEIELELEFADGEIRPVRFAVVPSAGAGRQPAHEH